MNRFLFLILIPVIFIANVKSQSVVIGNISNKSEPLINALVYFSENNVTYTDENGHFSILLSPNKYHFSIQYLGYDNYESDLVVSNENIDLGPIILAEKSTFLNEVNVTASSLPYKGKIVGTNYYVSPITMRKVQPISTEEILKGLPGLNVLGDMGVSNRLNVSIRGSWGRRSEKILMLEDGSPISPAPYTAPGIYYNPISDRIDAIEVITGADILRFGPNNMFGVINYITPKPPQEPALRAKLTYGQRNYLSGLLSYGGTWGKTGSQIEGVFKKFDGFTQNSSVQMVNLNAKIFSELSKTQSLYFKVSTQLEDNQATLSSITPYTYTLDPTQNPFDADRFTMHRYGLDAIHNYNSNNFTLKTKFFASDFARDWWRQHNVVIPIGDVKNYVGERIFNQYYSYLQNNSFTSDDFVRVGKITNGRESTSDSRWNFSVAGLEQTFTKELISAKVKNTMEMQWKLYKETYHDQVLNADSTKWARTGKAVTDLFYNLYSVSGFLRDNIGYKHWSFIPILRLEQVWMDRTHRIANAGNPNLTSDDSAARTNHYFIAQPGISVTYQKKSIQIFGSLYKGYIAPSKYFAYLVERDGVLVNPISPQDASNIKPEISFNKEIGLRGDIIAHYLSGQFTIYHNVVSNFYLAGWNEFFKTLGTIRLQGSELALKWNLLPPTSDQKLTLNTNISLLNTKVLSGDMVDEHLFTQIKHTTETKAEFVSKINANPNGYDVFTKDMNGKEIALEKPITVDQVSTITKTVYKYGDGKIENGFTPYSPPITLYLNLIYTYKNLTIGASYNWVKEQYAEFANFNAVSGDGGIGKIPTYHSYDGNINYHFKVKKQSLSIFLAAKNIGNNIYVASRLNRGQSGILPAGFRQINIGLTAEI
ncbi:MAG: carboxypeptidase-like regulatory domain-containing protein [Saprospiraceae bacterium]